MFGSKKTFCSDNVHLSDKFGIQEFHYSLGLGTVEEAYQMYDFLDELNIKNFRYIIFWWEVERKKGVYDWSRHDKLINYLKSKGLNILITFYGGNYLYDHLTKDYQKGKFSFKGAPPEGFPPCSSPALEGWLNFVEATVKRYGRFVKVWEIWNEENSGEFWQPVPNAVEYSLLLKATSLRIRKKQPEAFIIMGGVTVKPGFDKFLVSCFKLGALDYVNAVGIHPYRKLPEGTFNIFGRRNQQSFEEEIRDLRNLIAGYKQNIEIWDTESGYMNFENKSNLIAQAKYLLRSMLVEYAAGLKGLTYFKLAQTEENPTLFTGIVSIDRKKALPAYTAYKALSHILGSDLVKFKKSIVKKIGQDRIRLDFYYKQNKPIIAYWLIRQIDDKIVFTTRKLEIEGLKKKFSFRLFDVLNNKYLPFGKYKYNKEKQITIFYKLPLSDYPFVLLGE
ncbi:MAG: hypothetical protein B6D56_01380 [Candidatus Omnitrophica bacterium 4484_70.1]|nr:MAG: hypothetical protein B6D56_01380 [Candidatus Omnitrophica bacterium 4484_70.1]